MNAKTIVGIILIALGAVGLTLGMIPIKHKEDVVKVGGLRIEGEVDGFAVPKAVGIGAIVVGTALIVFGRKK